MRALAEVCEFCVFDLETTGLDPEAGAEPIEVAGVRLSEGNVSGAYESFACPRGEIPGDIQGLTGITPEDVRDAPSPAAVLGEFLEFAGDAILVAHNIDFDRSFLDVYAPAEVANEGIDTLRMARNLLGGTDHSLDHLVNRFGIDRRDAHRALEDARATVELFLELADRIDGHEDYVRCGIPRRLVREDLDHLLGVAGVPEKERSSLRESFRTTSSLLRADPKDVLRRTKLGEASARRVLGDVRDLYEDEHRSLEPSVRITNCYRLRFWGATNYVLNGIGLVLVLSGLVAPAPESFRARLMVSVPFFATSPIITYLRERSHGVVTRLLAGLLVAGAWASILLIINQVQLIRREVVSLLETGGPI